VAPLMSSTRLAGTEIEDMVRKVQLALIIRQYDPGPVDGALSAKTKAALSKFQADRGLTVSGFMDLQTLQALDVLR
jgi:peptidoglycan hydrolase-like protein with peptidoglycan-binding domain